MYTGAYYCTIVHNTDPSTYTPLGRGRGGGGEQPAAAYGPRAQGARQRVRGGFLVEEGVKKTGGLAGNGAVCQQGGQRLQAHAPASECTHVTATEPATTKEWEPEFTAIATTGHVKIGAKKRSEARGRDLGKGAKKQQ